jgi:2,5-furandicarboxylate decarboxylase 1
VPYADLRAFLADLEAAGELTRVSAEVDTEYELGAIARRSLALGGIERNQGIFFERPRGFDVPVACNLLTSRQRYYRALGTTRERLFDDWVRRTEQPLPPRIVRDGPCQAHVLEGDAVDLHAWPIPIWNERDGGRFITMPFDVTRDPVTGTMNCGVYRSMVHSRNTLGIFVSAYRGLIQHARPVLARGEPFPVAIAVGLDPVLYVAALGTFPHGVDEMAMAGALREEPVDLVRCVTLPLEVPAAAELVLECVLLPDVREEEGPFGEFTGYYGERGPRPVLRVQAITHRDQPIYEATYVGRPPDTNAVCTAIPREIELRRQFGAQGLLDVNLCGGGCMFVAVAQIAKRYEGQAKSLGASILGSFTGRIVKTVFVVDEDIDPFNWTDVEWALGTRFQPERDLDVLREMAGSTLDPSAPAEERQPLGGRTSKAIVDLTKPVHREFPVAVEPHSATLERVSADWIRYGFPY